MPHKKEKVDQKIESILFPSRNQRALHGENEGDIDKPHDAWFHLSSTVKPKKDESSQTLPCV